MNDKTQIQTTTESTGKATGARDDRALLPRVDVLEDESGITLLADLPGVPREQLELKVEGDTLWIEGAVAQNLPEGLEAVYAEVRVPRYRRAFTLSRELDSARIDANLKDGVLNLRIPKQAHAQPRRITVQAG
jgi:HSP20 family protein